MDRIPLSRYFIFIAIASFGCALDLGTKHAVFQWEGLGWGEVHWLWAHHAGIQKSLNEGALFGMGQGMVWGFALISIAAGAAIPIWLFRFRAAQDLWLTIALGCVMAGVLGNLYDRLGLPGLRWEAPLERADQPIYAVRDWILLQWNDQWRWPNFNIADSFLVIGASMLIVQTIFCPTLSISTTPARLKSAPFESKKRNP